MGFRSWFSKSLILCKCSKQETCDIQTNSYDYDACVTVALLKVFISKFFG